jgi:hypothetical protein
MRLRMKGGGRRQPTDGPSSDARPMACRIERTIHCSTDLDTQLVSHRLAAMLQRPTSCSMSRAPPSWTKRMVGSCELYACYIRFATYAGLDCPGLSSVRAHTKKGIRQRFKILGGFFQRLYPPLLHLHLLSLLRGCTQSTRWTCTATCSLLRRMPARSLQSTERNTRRKRPWLPPRPQRGPRGALLMQRQ